MPTAVVIVFATGFAISALILLVCAIAGFGQGATARILEGIGGLLCAINAVGTPFVDHVTIWSLLWIVAAPIAALSNVLRVRQARRDHREQLAATYAAEALDRQRPTA